MVKYRRQGIGVAFTDTIFNLLLGVTLMFFLALILMNPITEDKKIDSKAEFIITLDWPEEINSDIDLWTLDPHNNAVGYAQKENGPVTLERDDLGAATDTFQYDETGEVIRVKENHEIITVRSIMPGDWAINVFYYQSKSPVKSGSGRGTDITPPAASPTGGVVPVEVTVTLIKVNPVYEVIITKKVILTKVGEERTMVRFSVDEEGNIKLRVADPIRFVQVKTNYYNGY
jgi:hypothetical protein